MRFWGEEYPVAFPETEPKGLAISVRIVPVISEWFVPVVSAQIVPVRGFYLVFVCLRSEK